MLDPYPFEVALRHQEMTRTEWQQAERQAGQIARVLRLLGPRATRRAQAWRRRALFIPTATIGSRTTS